MEARTFALIRYGEDGFAHFPYSHREEPGVRRGARGGRVIVEVCHPDLERSAI